MSSTASAVMGIRAGESDIRSPPRPSPPLDAAAVTGAAMAKSDDVHTLRPALAPLAPAGADAATDAGSPTNPPSPAHSDDSNSSSSSDRAGRHQCPYCPQTYTRNHNLKSHLLTHSYERPFTCETCSSKFRRLHDLKRHLKLHTGEKPYVCKHCGRRFARGDALVRHVKSSGPCSGGVVSLALDEKQGEGDEPGKKPDGPLFPLIDATNLALTRPTLIGPRFEPRIIEQHSEQSFRPASSAPASSAPASSAASSPVATPTSGLSSRPSLSQNKALMVDTLALPLPISGRMPYVQQQMYGQSRLSQPQPQSQQPQPQIHQTPSHSPQAHTQPPQNTAGPAKEGDESMYNLVRMLEARVRVLEERLHVAEGRLSYVESGR